MRSPEVINMHCEIERETESYWEFKCPTFKKKEFVRNMMCSPASLKSI